MADRMSTSRFPVDSYPVPYYWTCACGAVICVNCSEYTGGKVIADRTPDHRTGSAPRNTGRAPMPKPARQKVHLRPARKRTMPAARVSHPARLCLRSDISHQAVSQYAGGSGSTSVTSRHKPPRPWDRPLFSIPGFPGRESASASSPRHRWRRPRFRGTVSRLPRPRSGPIPSSGGSCSGGPNSSSVAFDRVCGKFQAFVPVDLDHAHGPVEDQEFVRRLAKLGLLEVVRIGGGNGRGRIVGAEAQSTHQSENGEALHSRLQCIQLVPVPMYNTPLAAIGDE